MTTNVKEKEIPHVYEQKDLVVHMGAVRVHRVRHGHGVLMDLTGDAFDGMWDHNEKHVRDAVGMSCSIVMMSSAQWH